MRNINERGLNLIKEFEGFRSAPYDDGGSVWTIGYGHTRGVTKNTPSITKEQGETYLKSDIMQAEAMVETVIKVPLTDNQFSALVCLVFNTGPKPLTMSLGERLKQNNYVAAANEFQRWCYDNGKKMPGLVRRREAEKALFLEA